LDRLIETRRGKGVQWIENGTTEDFAPLGFKGKKKQSLESLNWDKKNGFLSGEEFKNLTKELKLQGGGRNHESPSRKQ